jgi:hypothetical protein
MIIASDVENTIRNGWRREYGAFGARSRLCPALFKFKRHNRSAGPAGMHTIPDDQW